MSETTLIATVRSLCGHTSSFEVVRWSTVAQAALNAVAQLPVMHLWFTMQPDFILGSGQKVVQSLRSFTALRKVHLGLININGPIPLLPTTINTLLQFAPELDDLSIATTQRNSHPGVSEQVKAPASSLFSGHRALRLRRLKIDGPIYTIDKHLPSCLNLMSLEQLVLPSLAGMVAEDFWLVLAEMARRSGGLPLKHLSCPHLTPGLLRFLLNFSTLEELDFDSGFHPLPLSHSPTHLLTSEPPNLSMEHPLMTRFFNTVLLSHKESLRSLSFCNHSMTSEHWNPSKEYLDSVLGCRRLTYLEIPMRYPGDHLVSTPHYLSLCLWLLISPQCPGCSGMAAGVMCPVAPQPPHVIPLSLHSRVFTTVQF